MNEPDFGALVQEGYHEAFAWFARRLDEGGADYDDYVFKQIRWCFKAGFLMGVVWQRRRDLAAGKKPA